MAVNFKIKVPNFLKSVRYCLGAVNGIFLITGLLLLIVGIIVIIQFAEYDELITARFFDISGFAIATAVLIILAAVLGFYGAISENFYVVAGYFGMLLVVLIFEIALVIAAFALKNDATSEISATMRESLQLYSIRLDIAKLWDDLQMAFECCGVGGRFDYVTSQIPVSCCHIDYGTVSPFTCETANAYTTGCATELGEWLSYNANILAITALVCTSIQTLLTAMSGWLTWRTKFEVVELES